MILTRDRSFYRSLLMLSVPIAVQYLIGFSFGLFDNIMIGRLGDYSLSCAYAGAQLQTLVQVFSTGVEGAILVLCAQYFGKGDKESVRGILSVGLKLSLAFGIAALLLCSLSPRTVISLFTKSGEIVDTGAAYLRTVAFSYPFFCISQSLYAGMRSIERARVGTYVSLLAIMTKVTLNYILRYGKIFAPMGIMGAAVATLVARIAECAVICVFTLFIDKELCFRLGNFLSFDKALFKAFIRRGAPVILAQVVWGANMLFASAIMGRLRGEGVLAGVSVASTLYSLCYVLMNGLSGAVGIITGKSIGEGNYERVREYARTVQLVFLLLGLFTGATLFAVREPFISLYTLGATAKKHAADFIAVLSVTVVGTSYEAACLFGLVRSGGDVSFVLKNDSFFLFFVVMPAAIAAVLSGAPPTVVFAALKCDQLLKCAVAYQKINSFDWIRNLTQKAT